MAREDANDPLARIRAAGPRLSSGQRRVAEYLASHHDDAAFQSAAEALDAALERDAANLDEAARSLDRAAFAAAVDALLAFSFARYTRRAVDALRLARARGAATIVITDAPLAPAAGASTHVLVVPVASHAFNHSYVAAVALIDALVLAWATRAESRTLASLEAFEQVLPAGDLLTP